MSNLYEEHKKLVAKVQELEDAIFKMKKYYEDILQNLTDDNFSASFVSEKRGMKSQISMTAEAIKTMVTDANFKSKIEQTASQIRSEVASVEGDLSSSITQTAKEITQRVADSEKKLSSQITTTATGIRAEIADAKDGLKGEIEATAAEISTKVSKTATYENTVVGTGEPSAVVSTDKIYYDSKNNKHYYHDGSEWVEMHSNSIYSAFQQTENGFKLIGDFSTTAQSGMNVDISGTRIDTYMGNSKYPKLSMGVSKGDVYYPVIIMGTGTGENGVKFGDFVVYPKQGVLIKDTGHFGIRYYYDSNEYIGVSMNDDGEMTIKADKINFVGLSDDVGTATIKGLTATFG